MSNATYILNSKFLMTQIEYTEYGTIIFRIDTDHHIQDIIDIDIDSNLDKP